jgi:CRISPR/Cas system-associated endoribonuclease Cas2
VIYVVAYDLHDPGRTYEPVTAAIKGSGAWAHAQGSVWLVDTLLGAEALLDRVRAAADSNDTVLVTQLQKNWWSVNLSAGVVAWLKDPSRRW